uniref:RNA-dependent RNA polymerase n=1 Tax=Ulva mito-like virus 2 TaxID=3051526 RepID=A0A9Y1YTI6_9VIRU|nr:MAG: RNA-dependent RNA polymerase [Ulva mito-like virus 2]
MYNATQQKLKCALKQVVVLGHALAVPRAYQHAEIYNEVYTKLLKSHGKLETLRIMKYLYDVTKHVALKQRYNDRNTNVWLAKDKSGVPRILKKILGTNFVLIMNEDVRFCRWALSLMSVYEIENIKPKPDVATLTAKSTCILKTETRIDLEQFIAKCVFPKSSKKITMGNLVDFMSIKSSPHGPSTPNWKIALSALYQSQANLKKVQDLETKFRFSHCSSTSSLYSEYKQEIENHQKVLPNTLFKTIGIPDKGPKVRTITMTNYFAQRALKPIHNYLMEVLRTIPEDGTYDHGQAAMKIKVKTLTMTPYCFDMTSATDRFPVWLQSLVVKQWLPDFATEWSALMTEAETSLANGNKIVFAVGQPMGCYSSWPAFTLSHHYIIRYSFKSVGADFRNNYYIIGDDVVIFHKSAADAYKKLIFSLGVDISELKSVLPERALVDNAFAAEFAKRLFLNGVEISPIRPRLLYTLQGRGWCFLAENAKYINQRWDDEATTNVDSLHSDDNNITVPAHPLIDYLLLVNKNKRSLAGLLLTLPISSNQFDINEIYSPPKKINPQGMSCSVWWGQFSIDDINKVVVKLGQEAFGYIVTSLLTLKEEGKKAKGANQGATPDYQPETTFPTTDPVNAALQQLIFETVNVAKNTKIPYHERAKALYEIGLNVDLAVVHYSKSLKFKDYLDLKAKRRVAMASLMLDIIKELSKPKVTKPKAKMPAGMSGFANVMLQALSTPSRLKILKEELAQIHKTSKPSKRAK